AARAADLSFTHHIVDPGGHAPVNPWGKAVGDIDGDGKIDLLAGGNRGGGLVWYANTGDMGRWTKRVIAEGAGFSTDIETCDVDADGDRDVIAIRGGSVLWYENPGWKAHPIGDAPMHDIETADFDGDGKPDIAARNQGEFGSRGDRLHFFRQVSPRRWTASSIEIPDGEGLLVRDVDGDGRPDVVINGTWYENTGGVAGWRAHVFAKAWTHKSAFVAMGDISGDGREDIVLAPSELRGQTYRLSWFEAPADRRGIWPEHIVLDRIEAVHHFVGIGDFDRDGGADIATAQMHQGEDPDLVLVLLNEGKGASWRRLEVARTGSHSMRIADLDGDGYPDLYGANHDSKGAPNGAPIEIWVQGRRKG
ncbi:MAG: VCBS repeat-containing protein, partial [Planctomycetes bacterium]|nr:VCBS repeat-containing protein [Planctomycetota bacterium]